MLPDIVAHVRVLFRVLAFPPLQVVQIAAEDQPRALDGDDSNSVSKSLSAFTASASTYGFRLHCAMPGNSPVSVFIETGSINGADEFFRPGMPVLAVRPVISQHGEAANLAERKLLFAGYRIPPDTAVAAIEAAGAAVIRSAVGHLDQLSLGNVWPAI